MRKKLLPQIFLVLLLLLLLTLFLERVVFFLAHHNSSPSQAVSEKGERVVATTLPDVHPALEMKSSYSVERVIDGDTIDISFNGTKTRVRLIGINTPETVDPRRPVQCFGKEASARAKELLSGKEVFIELDPSQDRYDKYGRLLAYIYLPNGVFFNELMIKEGYAYEYTYRVPYKYQEEFKQAERDARTNKRGLWADGVCTSTTTTSISQ